LETFETEKRLRSEEKLGSSLFGSFVAGRGRAHVARNMYEIFFKKYE